MDAFGYGQGLGTAAPPPHDFDYGEEDVEEKLEVRVDTTVSEDARPASEAVDLAIIAVGVYSSCWAAGLIETDSPAMTMTVTATGAVSSTKMVSKTTIYYVQHQQQTWAICTVDKDLQGTLAHMWASKVLASMHAHHFICVTDLPLQQYISRDRPETDALIRLISTRTLEEQNTVPALEAPNLVSGISAAVMNALQYRQVAVAEGSHTSSTCSVIVCYRSSGATHYGLSVDALRPLHAIQHVIKALGLSVAEDFQDTPQATQRMRQAVREATPSSSSLLYL